MLRTSEVESRATRASLTELLSPQMGKDIMWFLRRWAKTYLLMDEKLYEQVGRSLMVTLERGTFTNLSASAQSTKTTSSAANMRRTK